ncbi:alpha/beta fold hydrolase [Lentimicrobium sp. S6]|uniref:alpha/beta fold hydrolase n=1 Tax=Lentimicrobium sp. S6 TaxID=2735872 RepID=UPI0015523D09|nr:alpha/beta hydrolase [Lentimicrobium sp. S6]NPD44196.1 alpha/beta hydrolase [Lentimicrobium sp. S6]
MKKAGFGNINGQKIYYELFQKSEEAEYLVFLHEGLGSVAQWKNLPEEFSELTSMNVLVYDRSGYGKSSPVPQNYPYDYVRYEAQTILPKLLEQLKIETCHLFGHSDGATIALLFAAYHPQKCLSVISEAAHVIIENISVEGIRKIRAIYQDKIRKPLQKHHGDKTDWVFYHWSDTWIDPAFKSWNMNIELKQIKCPVLAIQGEDDEYGSPEQLKIIRDLSSAETHLIPSCGHIPHFQKPSEIKKLVMDFFKKPYESNASL